MIKKFFVIGIMLISGTFFINASDIDGKWKTTIQTPDGDMELVYIFKVDGEKLNGSAASPMGEVDLSNGKVDGNSFSFDIDVGMGSPIVHKCRFEEGIIKMTVLMDAGGGSDEIILKKVE